MENKMIPLVIEGTPRSGTRFFCNFIEHQFNIKIYRLQRIIHKYNRVLHQYKNDENQLKLPELINDLNSEIIIKERIGYIDISKFLELKVKKEFGSVLNALLHLKSLENGFDYWGLKFDNPSGMEICNKILPDPKFIHIIRDGRDVHLSACKCLSEGYYTPYNNSRFWKKLIEERRNIGRLLGGDRYIEVKYEDLLKEPKKTANNIANFLGKQDFSFKKMEIKEGNFDKWKGEMPLSQIKTYEAVAGDLLLELNYEVSYSNTDVPFSKRAFYNSIELPLKMKRYIIATIKSETRGQVIRRIKLKLKDYI